MNRAHNSLPSRRWAWLTGVALIAAWSTHLQAQEVPDKAPDTPEKAKEAAPEAEIPRVFVAKISAAVGANEGEASLLNDAVLVAIKQYEQQFDIRTSQDIEGIVKLEVAQTMAGCDVVSCAAEIGDALGADQLVTGQLGRVGQTWILSLTRTERSSLKALSRTQVRAVGDAPDVLFPMVESQTAELFGQTVRQATAAPTSGGPSFPLLIGGGIGLGLAVVAAATSGALYYFSFDAFNNADVNGTKSDFDNAIGLSQGLYVGTLIAGIGAAAIAVAGAGTIGAAFLMGDSE